VLLAAAVGSLSGCVRETEFRAATATLTDPSGGPIAGAVISIQQIDRRNFPLNPINAGGVVDYLERPRPEPVILGRTSRLGTLRFDLPLDYEILLRVLAPGGVHAAVTIRPVGADFTDQLAIVRLDNGPVNVAIAPAKPAEPECTHGDPCFKP